MFTRSVMVIMTGKVIRNHTMNLKNILDTNILKKYAG